MVGFPKTSPGIRETHRTQPIITLTAKLKEHRAKSAKGKGAWGKFHQKPRASVLPSVISPTHHTGRIYFLQDQTLTTQRKYCLQEEFISNSAHGFYWGWSHGHPRFSMYQNPKFQTPRRRASTKQKHVT